MAVTDALIAFDHTPLQALYTRLNEYGRHHNIPTLQETVWANLMICIPKLARFQWIDNDFFKNDMLYSLEDALFDVEKWALCNLTFDAKLLDKLDSHDITPIIITDCTTLSEDNIFYLSIIVWCQHLHDMPMVLSDILAYKECYASVLVSDQSRLQLYLTRLIKAISEISCKSVQARQRNRMVLYCLHRLAGVYDGVMPLNLSSIMIKHNLCVTLACLASHQPSLLGYVRIAQTLCLF